MTPVSRTHPVNDGFAVRAAAYYAALCVAIGIQMPFFPVWLHAQGIGVSAIGYVIAAPMVVRIFAVPIVARIADRLDALRAMLIAVSIGAAAGYAMVGLSHGFFAVFCTVAAAAIASTPTGPLADAYALQGLERRGRSYGSVRLWGSVAFIVANLGAGVLFELIAPSNLIWLIVMAYAATAAVSLGLGPLAVRHELPVDANQTLPQAHWRSPAFFAVAIAASLIQASHAVYYGFSTIDWTGKGLDGTTIGALWALGVVAEVMLFAMSARVPIGPLAWLALGAGGAVLRWSAMAFDPPTIVLPIVQCLHGLSFGATQLGAVQFLARMTARPGAAAQGDFAAFSAMAMAVSMGSSGLLYSSFADHAYAAMAVLAGAGAAILPFARASAVRTLGRSE